jgi:hypothetical protein
MSRRAFLPALVREVRVLSTTARGKRSYELSDLGRLPDSQLARLIPMIHPALAIELVEERLTARHRETGEVVDLVPAVRENVLALNLFDGDLDLGMAGRRLAKQMSWDEAEGFAYAKSLFLSLVGRLVYFPRYSAAPEE